MMNSGIASLAPTHQPFADRLHAIDAIRGFCLLNIFVNHITVGFLNGFSPSRIMFSDSAEAFVFLAGISCFLAYGAKAEAAAKPVPYRKIWQRARTLLVANSFIALLSIAILLLASIIAPPAEPSLFPSGLIEEHGWITYLWHVLTMQETVGFSVVLRLYVVLMMAAPLYIWLANRGFWLPIIPAGLIWLAAGHFGWAEGNSLSGVPLALTILPWNFVFAAGICLGAMIVQGKEQSGSKLLSGIAIGVVIAGPICFAVLTRISPDILAWIDARNDHFWTGASKSLQSPLRVFYMFALAYAFIALRHAPVFRLVHQVSPANMLARLGRRSLEVFSVGAILALIVDQMLWALFSHGILQPAMIAAIAAEIVLFLFAALVMLRVADSDRLSAQSIERSIVRVFSERRIPRRPANIRPA